MRGYGISNLIGDIFLILVSCGLWVIWMIVRENNIRRARGW